eukprot:6197479-Pleurochrysis_carterae.AAC.1
MARIPVDSRAPATSPFASVVDRMWSAEFVKANGQRCGRSETRRRRQRSAHCVVIVLTDTCRERHGGRRKERRRATERQSDRAS